MEGGAERMTRARDRVTATAMVLALSVVLPWLAASRGEGVAPESDPVVVRAVFLNVGKADAALLMLGEHTYLVDTGSKESAEALLAALRFWKVTRLDGVMVTHTDNDHAGGLKELLRSDIPVEQLYAPAYYNVKKIEKHPVYKQATNFSVPLTWLHSGDEIVVDQTIHFAVLGPLAQDAANENNNSLVLRLVTPQGDMLLTGDMEVEEEQALLNAKLLAPVAVLKVGHHGEDDASSEPFIYTVKPQVAVISTNSAVEADTPDPKVIRRLWNIGAEIFVTQKATCGVLVTLSGGNAVGRLVDYGQAPLP